MNQRLIGALIAALCAGSLFAAEEAEREDIDPIALKAMELACASIKDATNFSFVAVAEEDALTTDDQVITLFRMYEVRVKRPDKLYISMTTPREETRLYVSGESAYLFTPDKNVYSEARAPGTIDSALDALEKLDIHLPVSPLLVTDPFASATRDLETAFRVGMADVAGTIVYQSVYSGPHYEWQMWVDDSDTPLPRRITITDTFAPNRLRTVITLMKWNLDADLDDQAFAFTPPSDAVKIRFLANVDDK